METEHPIRNRIGASKQRDAEHPILDRMGTSQQRDRHEHTALAIFVAIVSTLVVLVPLYYLFFHIGSDIVLWAKTYVLDALSFMLIHSLMLLFVVMCGCVFIGAFKATRLFFK
jgi:ABC-type Fe3+ transport system permease subunit